MTVAELITLLQQHDPDAIVTGDANDYVEPYDGVSVRAGWYCPGLLSNGGDDFWADGERCSSWPDGVYHPRPEDRRAIHIGPEG